MKHFQLADKIVRFYSDGFRKMPHWGRKVWLIIIIKLFIILIVLKIFFFPDFLRKNFRSEKERGDYILERLTITTDTND